MFLYLLTCKTIFINQQCILKGKELTLQIVYFNSIFLSVYAFKWVSIEDVWVF